MTELGTLRGRVEIDIRRAVASYAALRAQNARTVYALRGTGDAMIATGKTMTIAGAGMVYAFGKAVQAAGEFERKMDFFGAVSDTNAKKMDRLSKYTLQVAQDTIYSAGEIADGFIELGKSGISAEQIMRGVGDAMANLGAAGDIPLAQSGQIITSAIQQFNLSAKEATNVADLLAGAANASIADIDDLGVSLKYVGGVAAAAGLDFEGTTTAISLLAKAGIRGSTAGTSLRQMIVSFGGATGPAQDALRELGIITGDNNNKFYDQQGNLKDLGSVFQILQKHTEDLTNKERLMYLRTIFNNRALSAAAILTREGAKGFREMNNEMSKTTAAEVARKRLDNLSGDLEILRGNIETVMIQAGTPFQETIRGWVQDLTRLVQVFGDLDPKTQKMIVQMIGMGGAALVAMGALNIIIGTMLKFIVHMTKMWAGLKFLGSILRIVASNAKWVAIIFGGQLAAALGVTTGMLLLIVAAALAFIAVWVVAYKKIGIFRKAVDAWYGSIWNAIKAFGAFLKLLVTDPGAAWDKIKRGADVAFQSLVDWAQKVPGLLQRGLSEAGGAVMGFVDEIVNWLSQLPGKALGVVSSFVGQVISLLTFRNIGFAIGWMVGTVVRLLTQLGIKAISLSMRMVTGVMKWIASMAPKAGYWIGFMVGRVIGLMLRLSIRMIALAIRAVTGVIRWISKLPGRVAGFIARMVAAGLGHLMRFANNAPRYADQAATGIVNFIKDLPGNVARLLGLLITRGRDLLGRFKTTAIRFAADMADGFILAILGLPGQVSGILLNIISAIKNQIQAGFNAVEGFAKGLWDGFREGIGMKSPSYLERAMWQITGVLDEETKKISKKTMQVQALSKKMAATQFSVGGDLRSMGSTPNRRGIMDLASMQSRNLNRARTLADAQGSRAAGARKGARGGARRKLRMVDGELRLDPSGRAFIKGVAQETIDDSDYYDDSLDRMG